jgi:hypothetical protein
LYETYNYSIEKSDNIYRIISLGDSFTQAIWVNTSDNYSELLEDLLNSNLKNCKNYQKFEVINLAHAGYDILYSKIRFENRGLKYKPDLVIWILKNDDFLIIQEIWSEFIKDVDFSDPQTNYEEFMKTWFEKTEQYINYNRRSTLNEESIHQKYIIEPLKDFFEITKKEKIKVIIFNPFHRISNNYDEILEKTMSNYSHVIYFNLNISEDFYKENLMIYYDKEKPYMWDWHPNEEGHKVIALKLLDFIKSNILKNC